MSPRVRVETRLKVRPVSRIELRAQCAAEWCVNLGASEEDGRIASRGVVRRAWQAVRIDGLDPRTGRIRDQAIYRIHWSGDHQDLVAVDGDDTRSMIERLDGGLAVIVRRTAERFRSKGLVLEVRFVWADHITEEDKESLRRELGVMEADVPPWEDGLEPRRVASLKPAKDAASSFEVWWGRRGGRS